MSAIEWTSAWLFCRVEGASAANNSTPLVDKARATNGRFKDTIVAVAEGYATIPCGSGVDGGAMDVDHVSTPYLKDGALDIKCRQEEPLSNGKVELVAVEYSKFEGPTEGPLSNFTNSLNRHGLGLFDKLHAGLES